MPIMDRSPLSDEELGQFLRRKNLQETLASGIGGDSRILPNTRGDQQDPPQALEDNSSVRLNFPMFQETNRAPNPFEKATEDYRTAIYNAPRVENYQPSGFRNVLSKIAGFGVGFNQGAEAGVKANEAVRYAPFNRAMSEYQQKLAGVKSIYDVESGLEESKLKSAKTRAEASHLEAQSEQQRAAAEKARAEARVMAPDYETALKGEIDKVAAQHPEEFMMDYDPETGNAVIMNKRTGAVRREVINDPTIAMDKLTGTLREIADAKRILADPNATKEMKEAAQFAIDNAKSLMTSRDRGPQILVVDPSNRVIRAGGGTQLPAGSQTVAQMGQENTNIQGSMTQVQAESLNRIIADYNRSPLIRAADRVGILKDAMTRAVANPSDAQTQETLLYAITQARDTYMSAVREGELNLNLAVQNYLNQAENIASKFTKDRLLHPDTILSMAKEAQAIVTAVESEAARKLQQFKSQAEINGLGPQWDQFTKGFNTPKGPAKMIRARDPQGNLHEAPEGTKLPEGWTLEGGGN